jgi:hypothetical protein
VKARKAKGKPEKIFRAMPATRKELLAVFESVVSEVAAMSSDERFATMVSAGIYTKSGKLTKHYGG